MALEKRYIPSDDECVPIESVKLDWDSIPEFVRNDIAATALKGFLKFMERPDAREILEATKERLRRESSTLLDPSPTRLM